LWIEYDECFILLSFLELGRDCTIAEDCNDVNVICVSDSNGKCQCNKDTHYDDNGDTSLGGSCIASKYGIFPVILLAKLGFSDN
jgi:hypothetical protein